MSSPFMVGSGKDFQLQKKFGLVMPVLLLDNVCPDSREKCQSYQYVCMYMCSCADWMPVTQPPVDVMTKTSVAARPQESAAAAHDAGNTRVIAVSLTVCIAALVCLIVIVRAHSWCRLVVRAFDSWLNGHMFDHFQLFHFQVTTRGKFTHTCFRHQAV